MRMLFNGSSMLTCMPNPASGLMFGSESKSVDRTKKLPWKLVMAKPLVALLGEEKGEGNDQWMMKREEITMECKLIKCM